MKKTTWFLRLFSFLLTTVMVLIGCVTSNEKKDRVELEPQFSLSIYLSQIPGDRNGEVYTISIIDRGQIMVSSSGTISGNAISAELKWKNALIIIDTDISNDDLELGYVGRYNIYIGLKIGNDENLLSIKPWSMYVYMDNNDSYRSSISTHQTYSMIFKYSE